MRWRKSGDLSWTPVVTHEMERAAYRINDSDRCYHCKAELMDVVGPIADADGATVVLGVNVDDLGDHRPGQRAADQRGAVFPLVTAGFTKADVREASRSLGLRTWDKPAAACLASRVPYGTEVTVALLSQVDRAEAAINDWVSTNCACATTATRRASRCRWIDCRRVARRADVVDAVKASGYPYVTLDLEGFRSGNLNAALDSPTPRVAAMKLSMSINYGGGFKEAAQRVVELEKAGLDQVWVAEAYSNDAISQVGYLAAITDRVEIGTGIVNVFSRTAALMAMTAAGCDYVSDGRFILGLGASGPQVIEGFHGVKYEKPMQRIKEYIEACRMIWKREEKFDYQGQTFQAPLPPGEGTGLGKPLKLINHPVRSNIPIWWASLKGLSVTATAEMADGWLPIMFIPEKFHLVWGDQLKAGLAKRDPSLPRLEIGAGGMLAIGDDLVGDKQAAILDFARPNTALYVGGMGARGKNFYNDICRDYGYEQEAVDIQDLYLEGKKDEAAARVPAEWLELSHLVGPVGHIKERVGAFKEAGVTVLSVNPVGPDPVHQIETLRAIVDDS